MLRAGRWFVPLLLLQVLISTPGVAADRSRYRLDVAAVVHADPASRSQIGFPVPEEGFGSTAMENHLGMSVRITRQLEDTAGAGIFLEGTRLSGRSEPIFWNLDASASGGPTRGQLQASSNAYSFHLLAGVSARKPVRAAGLPFFVQGSVAAGGAMGRVEQWTGVYDLDDTTARAALVTRSFLTGTQFSYRFDTSIGLPVKGYDIQGGLYYIGADLIRHRFALNGMGLYLAVGSAL